MPKKRVTFTKSFVEEFINRICRGESVIKITNDEHMPCEDTIYEWLKKYPTFSEEYARARLIRAERMQEEILNIVDSATNENYQAAKLQADNRKWIMSKMLPKQFGDKVTQEISGIDGNPIQNKVQIEVIYTDAQ